MRFLASLTRGCHGLERGEQIARALGFRLTVGDDLNTYLLIVDRAAETPGRVGGVSGARLRSDRRRRRTDHPPAASRALT